MDTKSYQNTRSPQGWADCKEAGDAGESLLIEVLRRMGYHVLRQAEGKASGFDVEISARVEIKTDLTAARTGKVAVELSRAGKPSGLGVTVADMWAFVVGSEALLVKVDVLRLLVVKPGVKEVEAGDPQRPTVCALVPLADLRHHARRIALREVQL